MAAKGTERSRPYDVVVFGASGFTGQYVAAEAARVCDSKKIAIAGRSKQKLLKTLDFIEEETGNKADQRIGIVIADIDNTDSIMEMCRQAHLVLNCVGPYRFYGEQVVQACIETSTNYVDVSGEPEFLNRIQIQYHDLAVQKGIFIIGSAGFDSVPNDVGTQFLKEKFPGQLTQVESYMHYHGSVKGNIGTYLTLIHSLANSGNLRSQYKTMFKEGIPYVGPKLQHRSPGYSKLEKCWMVPFKGADGSVIRRTQHYQYKQFGEPPVQAACYWCYDSIFQLLRGALMAIILLVLTRCKWGVAFLEKHPELCSVGLFSSTGLTKKELAERSFSMVFYGKGYSSKSALEDKAAKPDKEAVLRITGPEIGYIFCSIAMVAVGNILLDEKDKGKGKGGVLTPGSVTKGTSYVKRLEGRGVKFLLDKK